MAAKLPISSIIVFSSVIILEIGNLALLDMPRNYERECIAGGVSRLHFGRPCLEIGRSGNARLESDGLRIFFAVG